MKRDEIMNRENMPNKQISKRIEGVAGGVASLFGASTVVTQEYNEDFYLLPPDFVDLLNTPLTALNYPIDLEPAVVYDPNWQKFKYYRIPSADGDIVLLYMPDKLLADGRAAQNIGWMGYSWTDSSMGGNAKAMFFFSDSDSVADAFESVKRWFKSAGKIKEVGFFCEDFISRLISLDTEAVKLYIKSKLKLGGNFPTPVTMSQKESVKVFISYAHEDESMAESLIKQLKNLQRQKIISAWHDRKIVPSDDWAGEIDDHLDSAQIILLLISPDFMASDYCNDVEMVRAMEKHNSGEAKVVPVILRPVDWKGAPFSSLQALPKNADPITTWQSQDNAFLNVVQGIRKLLDEI